MLSTPHTALAALAAVLMPGRPGFDFARSRRASRADPRFVRAAPPTADELRHRSDRTSRRPEFRLKGCFRRRLISRAGLRLGLAASCLSLAAA